MAALDVGGTAVKGALFSGTRRLGAVERRSTRGLGGPDRLVKMVLDFASALVESGRATAGSDSVVGVGLAVPGRVDERRGVAQSSMILGWRQVPFAEYIRGLTGLPVGFGHDVRTAAMAERELGAARGQNNYLFVSIGTGVGSCIVLDGRAYTGAHGFGGELAHFVVEPEGPPCRCGKYGCLEMVASADAVARRYGELTPGGDRPSAREVAELARRGEGPARGVWGRAVAALGSAIAAYVELMDPGLVVVGGGMSEAGGLLFDPLRQAVEGGVSFEDPAPVVPAGLGDLAGLHGAALLALGEAVRGTEGASEGVVLAARGERHGQG